MEARWVGSSALVLVSVLVRFQRVAVPSRGYSPPQSERLAGWGSVFLKVEYWGALESGEGCEEASQVQAHWAVSRGRMGPGYPVCCAPAAQPASGAVAAGDWELVSGTVCWSTSGMQRAARSCRAGREPGPRAGWEEKGFRWLALVTDWVNAEMFLENSGPRDGQEGVSRFWGCRSRFFNSCTKGENTFQ